MKIRRLLAPVMIVVCCTASVVAQQRLGRLVGIVKDRSSQPVPAAKITLISPAFDRVVRAVVTGPDGSFDMTRVPSGEYRVVVSKPGVADFAVQNVRIEPGTDTNLGEFVVGAQDESESRIPVVNTTSAMRGGEFSTIEIESLPLGGTTEIRTFDEFVFLLPGVSPAPLTIGVRGPGVGFGSGQFSVNGQRARSNNFTIDGSDNNDPDVGLRRQGFVALVPQSIESIQQFQVSTLLYDAESGRNFGGQINAVSKGGSNRFGGQAYGFFTNRRLNARSSFDYTGGASQGEDPFTRMQSGFVVGGPVVKDRTQFLIAYEHQDVNASIEQHFATINLAERRFLGLQRFGVLRPFPRFPVDSIYATESGSTPVGSQVLSFYPLPNDPGGPYGDNTYTEVLPADGDGTVFSAKLSHQVTDDHLLEARYNFLDDDRVLPSFNQAIRSTLEATTRTQNLSLILNSSFGDAITNQLRASFGRKTLAFVENPDSPFLFRRAATIDIDTPDGAVQFNSDTGRIGQLLVEPYSAIGVDATLFPQGSSNNAFQVADTMAWSRGRHAMKFGVDIRRIQLNSFQDRLYRPLVTIGSGFQEFGDLVPTGDPDRPFGFVSTSMRRPLLGSQLAAIGIPTSVTQVLTRGLPNSEIGLRFTEYGGFVHDTWQVRPNLTIEAGLRYEFNTVPGEVNRRIEDAFELADLDGFGPPSFDVPDAQAFFDRALRSYETLLGGREKIYDSDPNNFAPRIGFAWDPMSGGRMSVRGGYGVYFDTVLGALVSQSRNVFPTEVPITLNPQLLGTNVFRLPDLSSFRIDVPGGGQIPLVAPGALNQFGGLLQDYTTFVGLLFAANRNAGGIAATLPEKDLASPYSQHWHLTVEHEVPGDVALSVAYVGTKGTKLTRLTTPNLGPNLTPFLPTAFASSGTPFPQGLAIVIADGVQSLLRARPDRFLGPVLVYENSASSTYHALQVEARRRYVNGLAFSAAYTWSHVIDDVSDVLPIAGASSLPENTFNLRLERGSANFDVRHRVSASFVWDLPYLRDGSGARAAVFGNWQIASMFRANTGQPFTLRLPVDANLDGNLTDRPTTDDGLVVFDGHGPQRIAPLGGDQFPNYASFLFDFDPTGTVTILGERDTVGRNTFRADSFVNLDVAFTKTLRLGETRSLLLRTEIFNALNRANYGLPVRTLFAPGFGRSIDTVNPARIVQFALKLTF